MTGDHGHDFARPALPQHARGLVAQARHLALDLIGVVPPAKMTAGLLQIDAVAAAVPPFADTSCQRQQHEVFGADASPIDAFFTSLRYHEGRGGKRAYARRQANAGRLAASLAATISDIVSFPPNIPAPPRSEGHS